MTHPTPPNATERCETCRFWEANTVGRILGWCLKKGPIPDHPLIRCTASTAYHDRCGEYQRREG